MNTQNFKYQIPSPKFQRGLIEWQGQTDDLSGLEFGSWNLEFGALIERM